MTREEVERILDEAGIPVGSWKDTHAGHRPSALLARQGEVLRAVREVVARQVTRDKAEVARLHEVLGRMKHGGGR